MIEFLRFTVGVVLSAIILGSVFALILKNIANWLNPKEESLSTVEQQVPIQEAKPRQTAA